MTKTQIDQPVLEGKLPTDIGAMLAPLFTWRGRDVYPVFGAEGEDDGEGDQDGEPGTEGEGGTGTGTEEKGSETVTRAEFDALQNRLRMADKNKAAAEKKLKDAEDAKKDEYTKATERVEELEKTVASNAKELGELRLQNAFLSANTGIAWHDPADALALAERQGYLAEVVGEDGKVDTGKLTVKLKELAKAKPHLVKKDGTADDGKGKSQGPTGSKVGSKNTGGKDEPDLTRYDRHFNR